MDLNHESYVATEKSLKRKIYNNNNTVIVIFNNLQQFTFSYFRVNYLEEETKSTAATVKKSITKKSGEIKPVKRVGKYKLRFI